MNVQRSGRRYFNIYLYLPTVWGYSRGVFRGVMEYAVPRCRWRFLHESDRYEDDAALPVECDGAILLASTPRMIRWAERCGRPVVLVSGRMPTVQRCAIVCPDDERVGSLAAEHLLGLGLKRLAYLPHDDGPICARRRRGFEEAAVRHGAEVLSLPAGIVRDRRIADRLGRTVRSWIKPVGVFAFNDRLARLFAQVCREWDIGVPDEIAIIGADNDEMECLTSYPPLTSVDTRPWDIGRAAAELLETWLERESKASVRIEIPPVHVVSRRSTDMFAVDDERLLKALRYIREHACDPCRVSDVAAQAGVPRRWLERRVFAVFGCTPHDLILRHRLQEAEALLAETDMKLLDVAERTGFRYESNLRRTLRQVLGLTVSQIRKGRTAVAGRRDTRRPRMPLAPLTKTGPKTVPPFGPG